MTEVFTWSRRARVSLGVGTRLGFALVLVVPTLLPVAWIISSSLKNTAETHTHPPTFIPSVWTLETYFNVLGLHHFFTYMANSLLVALVTTVIGVLVAAWGGYGFARYNFPFKGPILGFVLAAQSFPRILMVIPFFQVAHFLRLQNTYFILILAYSTFVQPFCIWMMKEYFSQIPTELQEAALIDGCGHYGAFMRVVLPLVRPALAATAILSFLTGWNEYEFALVLTNTDSMRTVSVGVAYFVGEFAISWNQIMAAAAIATIPVIVVFMFFQKSIVDSLSAGAVKG